MPGLPEVRVAMALARRLRQALPVQRVPVSDAGEALATLLDPGPPATLLTLLARAEAAPASDAPRRTGPVPARSPAGGSPPPPGRAVAAPVAVAGQSAVPLPPVQGGRNAAGAGSAPPQGDGASGGRVPGATPRPAEGVAEARARLRRSLSVAVGPGAGLPRDMSAPSAPGPTAAEGAALSVARTPSAFATATTAVTTAAAPGTDRSAIRSAARAAVWSAARSEGPATPGPIPAGIATAAARGAVPEATRAATSLRAADLVAASARRDPGASPETLAGGHVGASGAPAPGGSAPVAALSSLPPATEAASGPAAPSAPAIPAQATPAPTVAALRLDDRADRFVEAALRHGVDLS